MSGHLNTESNSLIHSQPGTKGYILPSNLKRTEVLFHSYEERMTLLVSNWIELSSKPQSNLRTITNNAQRTQIWKQLDFSAVAISYP